VHIVCHVSYSKLARTSCTLLYTLGYFPEILPRGYCLGISRRPIVCLLVPILLDNTPCGTQQYTMRYLTLLLLFSTILDLYRWRTIGVSTVGPHGSVLAPNGVAYLTLPYIYLSYLTYSIVALQYSNYCYPVHILLYAYNTQNYTHQSTGRP
jgi:hypothetical protein